MRHQKSRGYTLVEVLMAVIFSSLGFAAIFALQIGTTQANISARDLGSAVNLAERSVEILQRDAYGWLQPGAAGRPGPWLNKAENTWHTMTPIPVDQNGRLHLSDDPQGTILLRQRFCVQYLLSPEAGAFSDLLSARVRVVWPKAETDADVLRAGGENGRGACSEEAAQNFAMDPDFFSLTLPVSIRRHDQE